MRASDKALLTEDADNMENALIRLGEDDGIWQNGIIRALCRAVYDLIIAFLHSFRREKNCVGEFEKVSALQFLPAISDCLNEGAEKKDEFLYAYDHIILPSRATSGSAGYDIHSPISFTLLPGATIKIPSGIRVRIDDGWWLGCLPRSSIGFKYRVSLDNTMGVIDSDYYNADNEGHIFLKITNNGERKLVVNAGDRIVQAIFIPYGITYSDEAPSARTGGMGSTGA